MCLPFLSYKLCWDYKSPIMNLNIEHHCYKERMDGCNRGLLLEIAGLIPDQYL